MLENGRDTNDGREQNCVLSSGRFVAARHARNCKMRDFFPEVRGDRGNQTAVQREECSPQRRAVYYSASLVACRNHIGDQSSLVARLDRPGKVSSWWLLLIALRMVVQARLSTEGTREEVVHRLDKQAGAWERERREAGKRAKHDQERMDACMYRYVSMSVRMFLCV